MAVIQPLASIVIPTYGRPKLLRECVERTLAQVCSFPFEVVVIDDGGDPPARSSLSFDDPRLRVIRVNNGGPAKARNEGIRRAVGQYVAFLDDDCVPEPGWLQAAMDGFSPEVIAVHGPVKAPRPASPLEYHFVDTGSEAMNVTANLVVRRDALLSIGGFDEGFPYAAGEDFDLCWRLERLGQSRFVEGARVVHALIPLSWRKRRSRPRMFATFFRLYALHPERLDQTGLPGLSWARPLILKFSPPLWIGTYVTLMPVLEWMHQAPRTKLPAVLSELAASCLNVADSFRHAGSYLSTYRDALAQGPRPGLSGHVQSLA